MPMMPYGGGQGQGLSQLLELLNRKRQQGLAGGMPGSPGGGCMSGGGAPIGVKPPQGLPPGPPQGPPQGPPPGGGYPGTVQPSLGYQPPPSFSPPGGGIGGGAGPGQGFVQRQPMLPTMNPQPPMAGLPFDPYRNKGRIPGGDMSGGW